MIPNDKKTYKMVLKGIAFFWEITIPFIRLLSYLSVSNKKRAYEDVEMYVCACVCVLEWKCLYRNMSMSRQTKWMRKPLSFHDAKMPTLVDY